MFPQAYKNETLKELIINSEIESNSNSITLLSPSSLTTSTTFILPSSSGTTGQILESLGNGSTTWSTVSGGGTAAGNNREVQFNNSGVFGASSSFYFDDTNVRLGIGTNTPSFTLDINGQLKIGNNSNQEYLQIYRENGVNDYQIQFQAPSAIASSLTFTWPPGDGASGEVIVTDAAGNLTWGIDATGGAGDCVGIGTGEQDGTNTADGSNAFVGGGVDNTADGSNVFIGGGENNTSSGDDSAILTGSGNNIGSSGDNSIIAGGSNNFVNADNAGIFVGTNNTINLGGDNSYIGGGRFNYIASLNSGIIAGESNTIYSGSDYSIIGTGQDNEIINSDNAGIVSGNSNTILNADFSLIGAGLNNIVSGSYSIIGGGEDNLIDGDYNFLGGGRNNSITGNYSAILGGEDNFINGDYSFVLGNSSTVSADYAVSMGRNANANFDGSFVFGDAGTTTVSATTTNQFVTRFDDGYDFYTDDGFGLGVELDNGDNAWSSISDRNKKQDFLMLNKHKILEKVNSLRISSWNYKGYAKKGIRNYGPMAQDFYLLFGNDGLGQIGSDTTITSNELTSVGILATQALIEKQKIQQVKLDKLKEQNDELEFRIKKAKKLLDRLEAIKVEDEN